MIALHGEKYPTKERTGASTVIKTFATLTYAVNSLNHSMGQPDLYPFVLAPEVMGKLRFVHGLIHRDGPSRDLQARQAANPHDAVELPVLATRRRYEDRAFVAQPAGNDLRSRSGRPRPQLSFAACREATFDAVNHKTGRGLPLLPASSDAETVTIGAAAARCVPQPAIQAVRADRQSAH